jgi:VanZ family protein
MTTPDERLHRPAAIALAIYTAVIAVVGLFPAPVDRELTPWLRWVVAALHRRGMPDWFDYHAVEFAANIGLFVPFGLLAVAAFGRRNVWVAVLAGVDLSAAMEFGQWLLLPERFPSELDVLANTIGTVIGAAIGYAVIVIRRPGTQQSDPGQAGEQPGTEQPGTSPPMS